MPKRIWTDEDLIRLVPEVTNLTELCKKLGISRAACTIRTIQEKIRTLNLSIEHFESSISKKKKEREILTNLRACNICGQEKPFEEYSFRDKKHKIPSFTCRECQKKVSIEHYQGNVDAYKQRAVIHNKKTKTENQKKICEYLEKHPCEECGESNICVLEFHHLHSKDKAISNMIHSNGATSWETIEKEIQKCRVLCANCHRKITLKDYNSYRDSFQNKTGH